MVRASWKERKFVSVGGWVDIPSVLCCAKRGQRQLRGTPVINSF